MHVRFVLAPSLGKVSWGNHEVWDGFENSAWLPTRRRRRRRSHGATWRSQYRASRDCAIFSVSRLCGKQPFGKHSTPKGSTKQTARLVVDISARVPSCPTQKKQPIPKTGAYPPAGSRLPLSSALQAQHLQRALGHRLGSFLRPGALLRHDILSMVTRRCLWCCLWPWWVGQTQAQSLDGQLPVFLIQAPHDPP